MRQQRAAWIRLVIAGFAVLAAGVYFLLLNPVPKYIHKGLDLQGGIEIVFQAHGTPQQPYTTAALTQTVQVINLRVNRLGVSEPVVQAEPSSHRILVQLAGVKNPEQAQAVIGKAAVLQFKDSAGHIIVTGSDLKSATYEIVQGQGNVVALTFDAKGRQALAKFTSANVGKPMPIYLDGKMVMNPNVIQAITNGQAILTGGFTPQQAQTLAIQLDSGALPLSLSILSKQTVSATLGADSVHASELAALVALALVAGFMLLIYRVPGWWADLALLVYALLLLGVLVGVHATLTLPGITGLILSIGMAVDSNVIIYERIKEELRAGRSLRTAVDEGFKNGLRAIVDSNATTLIAAIVLYYLGSGLIRGFAVTVGIGVLISLLTAVVFTRYLIRWLVETGIHPSAWVFAPRGSGVLSSPVLAGGPALAAAGAGGGTFTAAMGAGRQRGAPVRPPAAPPPRIAPAAHDDEPDRPATPAALGSGMAGRAAGAPASGAASPARRPNGPRGGRPGARKHGRRGGKSR